MAQKRILFINRMAPFNPGGARKVVWELGKEMAKRGWEVHFFYASHLEEHPDIPNMFFHPIKTSEDYFKMTYGFLLKGPCVFKSVLSKVKPDMVYDNANPVVFFPAYLWARDKLVVRVHHVARREVFMLKSGIINPVATYILEEFLRSYDGSRIIVDSNSTKKRIWNLVKNPDKMHVIPPGIERPSKPVTPIEKRISGQVVCICRMVRSKGVDYLLKAWKLVETKHPEAKLIIAGKGPQEKEFRILADNLKLKNCKFLGFISDKRKEHLLDTSMIYILPTLIEGLPLGILEAMTHNIPIITTNTWGTKDLIEDNINGLLVPPRNHIALADAIVYLLENPDIAKQMAYESLKRVKEFYIDKVNNREIELLENMLSGSLTKIR